MNFDIFAGKKPVRSVSEILSTFRQVVDDLKSVVTHQQAEVARQESVIKEAQIAQADAKAEITEAETAIRNITNLIGQN